MRAVKFSSLLEDLAGRMGGNADVLRVNPGEAMAYFSAINDALQWAWEAGDWRWLTPTVKVAAVRPEGGVFGEVDWATEGMPVEVFSSDPRLGKAETLDFEIWPEGFNVAGSGDVWVRYMPLPPVWSARVWAASTQYLAGDVVYDTARGEGYRARMDTLGRPVNDSAAWEKLVFPYDFKRPVLMKAQATLMLGREDQQQTAAALNAQAEGLLGTLATVQSLRGGQRDTYQN